MDPRIIAALMIGAVIGLLGTMILACLVVDSREEEAAEKMWRAYNDKVHNSGRPEGQAAPEVQPQDGDDIYTD